MDAEAFQDALVQFILRLAGALLVEVAVVADPFIHLGVRRVVVGHQLLQLLLRRVVHVRHGHGDAGLLLDEIADGLVAGSWASSALKRPIVKSLTPEIYQS